jgi:4-amino-4-deoxy-L-arabinose transferase-like glycosyltransferase
MLAGLYFFLIWLSPILGSYRYFIDEFYYLACANHLSLGYVDHPPLSIFILWVVRGILGDSLLAIRLVPALAGGVTIMLVGNLARRLGAAKFGQLAATAAMMITLIGQVMFSYYSMNAISIMLWAVGFTILVRIERERNPRLWLAFGIVIGLGLLNKHTFILFPIGLVVGLLLTPARRHFANRWFWFGAVAALLLVLPNLVWQQMNGWPSLEFYRNADFYKNVPTPPLQIVMYQILSVNPGALIVWTGGLFYLLLTKHGRELRHLGWIYIVLLTLMIASQSSRPDRIFGGYLILLATGGVWLARISSGQRRIWIRWALGVLLSVTGLALLPLGLPLLSVQSTSSYAAALGVVPQIEQSEGAQRQLPLWIGYRIDWEEFVDDIATVANEIDSSDLSRTVIIVPAYGLAGSIELLGSGRHLPPVYATQNHYYHWGPPPDSTDVAIIVGFSEETIRQLFVEASIARIHECAYCIKWRAYLPIWLVRHPKVKMSEIWPHFRHYE